jgi:hypothetical protein
MFRPRLKGLRPSRPLKGRLSARRWQGSHPALLDARLRLPYAQATMTGSPPPPSEPKGALSG